MADVRFELDRAGLMELCKSPEMQVVLLAEAESMAGAANRAASGHEGALHITEFEKSPYAARVDVLDRTAVGVAHVNSKMGLLDEAKFKSLSAQNH